MSPRKIVECANCKITDSFMWHKVDQKVLCVDCHKNINKESKKKTLKKTEDVPSPKPKGKSKTKQIINTNRQYRTRQQTKSVPKVAQPVKGRGRRRIFKKQIPIKIFRPTGGLKTVSTVYHEGTYFRIGDIVSVRDEQDNGIYYAQIKMLMIDLYCEKSASLTWLLPTISDLIPYPQPGFDPMRFILGPDDDRPHKIDCLTFVMHAPSDYYRQNTPFPTGMPPVGGSGFVWGRLHSV